MSSTIKISPKKIEDYDVNSYTGKSSKFNYGGKVYKCHWAGDKQYKHAWTDLNNLLSGGVARCGDRATKLCSYSTHYNIAGFRNTCPIAGQCGTYATPAALRISNFNFSQQNIKGKNKISKVVLTFSHKNNGVNVANGQETSSWGGKFSKVTLTLYKYDGQTKKYSKIASKTVNNNPPVNKYQNCITTFNINSTINLSNKDNLALDIIYDKNENTNPCIIRMKGLSVQVTYSPIEKPKLNISTTNEAYGDSIIPYTCATDIVHTITANYTGAAENIRIIQKPNDWEEISRTINDKIVTYIFKDHSENIGDKEVVYGTTYNDFETTINGRTTLLEKVAPEITMVTEYKKSDKTDGSLGSDYNQYIKYLEASGHCFNKLVYTIDDDKTQYEVIRGDISTEDFNQAFYKQMSELDCGTHIIHFSANKNPKVIKHITIKVIPPEYLFQIIMPTFEKDDGYIQNKKTDREKKYAQIIRIDNEKSSPIITSWFNESWTDYEQHGTVTVPQHNNENLFKKDDSILFEIGTHFHGSFDFGFYYSNYCSDNLKTSDIQIIYSNHKQYYDNLYIRAKNTPHKYESIVIKKGDSNTSPVTIDNLNFEDDLANLVFEVNGGQESLSNFGLGVIKITNNGNKKIENLFLELNPKTKKHDSDNCENFEWSNEWFGNGIFNGFQQTFFEYNPELEGLVEIINLTPDDDNIDEEDVFINITEIDENETVLLYIPFMSKSPKEVYVDLYINGVKIDRDNNTENIYGPLIQPYEDGEFYIEECHNLKFIINDLIDVDVDIKRIKDDGTLIDDIDMNNCSNDDCSCSCCEGLKVRYIIKSEDTQLLEDETFKVSIINSLELTPLSYSKSNGQGGYIELENGRYVIKESEESSLEVSSDKFTKGVKKSFVNLENKKVAIYINEDGQIKKYYAYTQKDGIGVFNYEVPKTRKTPITINDLENNIVMIQFEGDFDYKPSSTFGFVNQNKIKTNITIDDNDFDRTFCSIISLDSENKYSNLSSFVERTDKVQRNDIIIISGILQDNSENGIENKIIEFITKTTSNQRTEFPNIDKNKIIEDIDFNKKGSFNFFVYAEDFFKDNNITSISINDILNNIFLRYNGDDDYEKSIYSPIIKESEITPESERNVTKINVKNNYRKYKPGSIIPLEFTLQGETDVYENKFDFTFKFESETSTENGLSEQVAYVDIFYRDICNENRDKIFKTSIKTNDNRLVPIKKTKNIYCNIPTELNISATMEKSLMESGDTNIIRVYVNNGLKPNKNVQIKVKLLPNSCCPLTECSFGKYELVDVSYLTEGSYSYDDSENILTWEVGDMEPYTSEYIVLDIKADNIGETQVSIKAYDYLNQNPGPSIERDVRLETLIKSDYCKESNNGTHFVYAYYPNKQIYIASVLLDEDTQQEIENQFIKYSGLEYDGIDGAFTQNYNEDESILVKGANRYYRFATSFADPSQVKRESHTYALYHYTPLQPRESLSIESIFEEKSTDDYIYHPLSSLQPNEIKVEKIPTVLYYKHTHDNFYNIYLKERLIRVNNNKPPTPEENLIFNQQITINNSNYNILEDGYVRVEIDDIENASIEFEGTIIYDKCSTCINIENSEV